jgi:hypothetical protein
MQLIIKMAKINSTQPSHFQQMERNNKLKASAIRAEAFNLLFRNTVRVPKQEQMHQGWQHQTP